MLFKIDQLMTFSSPYYKNICNLRIHSKYKHRTLCRSLVGFKGQKFGPKTFLTKELRNACIDYTGNTYDTVILITVRRQLTTCVSIYVRGM